jgi:hypothetical protein
MKRLAVPILAVSAIVVVAVALVIIDQTGVIAAEPTTAAEQVDQPDKAAIERSRRHVRMLDNIYKQTIVLITDKYVHDESDFAAGSAAVLLFKNISESGSHQVRLIDATGDPVVSANLARDDFEREGIKRLRDGAGMYDQVQTVDGKPQLRALTPVPVVMEKCIMCHDHYADVKKGEPIGAISYTIPIE